MHDEFIHDERVAYFTMEVALRSEIPTYKNASIFNSHRMMHRYAADAYMR